MRMITVLRSVILSLGLLAQAPAALADGIELPTKIKPGLGGRYVLRASLVTNNNVTGLQYAPFAVAADGRIGEELAEVQLRPATLNTRAGEKRQVLVTFPTAQAQAPTRLALCMWREPDVPKAETSQMINAFRYCKLFAVEP